MGIEYNKDLHIEVLRDEIILTREELLRKYHAHNTFREIVNEVHSTIQLDELREIARSALENVLDLNRYVLMIWNRKEKHFVILENKNMKGHDEEEALMTLDSVKNGTANREESSDLVYLPINEGKIIYGALCLHADDYPAKTAGNGEVLRLAMRQLSKALENSIIHEDVKKRAVTDEKTLLYNFSHLNERLITELRRCVRYDRRLAVLMIDIDDFKKINDTYGHVKGDEILAETAWAIKKTCRDIDILARFGGDEFIVLVPESDLIGAKTLAERVRESVRRHRFDTGHGFEVSVTVSIGVSAYPDHSEYANELVKLSDQALLAAKQAGKNKVHIAAETDTSWI